jgi:hypothetical protein
MAVNFKTLDFSPLSEFLLGTGDTTAVILKTLDFSALSEFLVVTGVPFVCSPAARLQRRIPRRVQMTSIPLL